MPQTRVPMPANTALKAKLDAFGSVTSLGEKTLTTTPVDLVNNISHVAGGGFINYKLEANLLADPITTTKKVTYVITAM